MQKLRLDSPWPAILTFLPLVQALIKSKVDSAIPSTRSLLSSSSTGKSKRFRLKRMSSCPRGWPGSGPHFLPWPQPAGPGNPGLGPLQPCLSLSRTPTWLPAAQQGPAGLGRRGKAYQADFLPSCSFGGA